MLREAPASAYRLSTSDDTRALALASSQPGIRMSEADDGGLVVEANGDALDATVLALGRAGVAVRRLELTVTPLESMFFALAEQPRITDASKPQASDEAPDSGSGEARP
jgi:ABC-2 type transport system ATP-binding protein